MFHGMLNSATNSVIEPSGDVTPVEVKGSVGKAGSSMEVATAGFVPVGHDVHGGHRGFAPSDAALVRSNETAGASRDILREASSGAKDNLIQSLETKFQLERSIKESQIATEQANRRLGEQLAELRAGVQTQFAAMETAQLRASVDGMRQSKTDELLAQILKAVL